MIKRSGGEERKEAVVRVREWMVCVCLMGRGLIWGYRENERLHCCA